MDPTIFITWLTGGSAETRDQLVGDVVDHRAKTVNTHYKNFWCSFMMDVAVAVHRTHFFYYHGIIDIKGHRRGCPPNNYPSPETDAVSILFFIGCPDASCLLHALLLSSDDVYPQSNPHSASFQAGRCRQRLIYPPALFVSGIRFCPFITILM